MTSSKNKDQRRWARGLQGRQRGAGRNATNGFLLLLLSLVSFAEFYCITMNCALTKFGQQMKRNEWEIDAKKVTEEKTYSKYISGQFCNFSINRKNLY